MEIKDRISLLSDQGYFKEMKTVTIDGEMLIYVIVNFPPGWIIDDEIEEKFDVTVKSGGYASEYYFVSEMSNGFDRVFDAIEYNISRMKAIEERAALLRQKKEELGNLFRDETISLEALRTLEFTFSLPRKKRGPKAQTKSEEDVSENNGDNDMED